jgi:hypothetical protein
MQKHANLVAYRDRITSLYFTGRPVPVAKAAQADASSARRVAHG